MQVFYLIFWWQPVNDTKIHELISIMKVNLS